MNAQGSPRSTGFKEKNLLFVSYILVSLMMGSAALVLIQLVQRISPEWQATYLPGVVVFVALERLYTYRYQQGISPFSKQWVVSQIAQWVIMAIIIKLVISISHGVESIIPELLSWVDDFSTNFFDWEFIAAICIVIFIWWICGRWADLLSEILVPGSSKSYEFIYYRQKEKPNPRHLLIGSIMTTGAGLVALTGLLRSDLRAILGDQYGTPVNELPYLAGGGVNVLLYFVFGFALISMSKYAALSAEWNTRRITYNKNIPIKWALFSILFLVTISILVSFLPTNYSLDLMSSLSYLVGIVINFIIFLFGVVIFLSIYVFSLFGFLIRESPGDFQPPTIPKFSPESTVVSGSPVPWLDVLKSLIFWTILLGIVYLSVKQYLKQHRDVVQLIRKIPIFKFIIDSWHWLLGLFRGINRQVNQFVDKNIQRLIQREALQTTLRTPKFLSFRGLSPREKVIFLFLAMIRRAKEGGVPRRASQTPY
ncbi:MAG: hypothetical protein PVG32_01365, partial [Anaerolineales bacterium]